MTSGDEKLQEMLKNAIGPATELQRDLWPGMLARLQEKSTGVPWFDWVLAVVALLALLIYPHTIPVLLYHL